ncbi:MAG: hypothetical protein ACHP7I_06800 [Terriglobales bacterium]
MDGARAFFPLRSNIGWYSSPELRHHIERTLKEALLVYDEVLIEAGTYTAEILEHGTMAFYLPPGSADPAICRIDVERDLKPGNVSLSVEVPSGSGHFTPVLSGHAYARFKIDFLQLLEPIANHGDAAIKLIVFDPAAASKAAGDQISRMNFEDQRHLKAGQEAFFEKLLIQNVNRDLIAAMMLDSSLVLDDRHDSVLREKCAQHSSLHLEWTGEHPVIHTLVSVAVPDFDCLSISDILDLRSDKHWEEFRGAVGRITSKTDALTDCDIQKALSKTLVRELQAKHKTGVQLTIDLVLGSLSCLPVIGPVASAVAAVQDLSEFIRDQRNWTAFVLRMNRRAVAKRTNA